MEPTADNETWDHVDRQIKDLQKRQQEQQKPTKHSFVFALSINTMHFFSPVSSRKEQECFG